MAQSAENVATAAGYSRRFNIFSQRLHKEVKHLAVLEGLEVRVGPSSLHPASGPESTPGSAFLLCKTRHYFTRSTERAKPALAPGSAHYLAHLLIVHAATLEAVVNRLDFLALPALPPRGYCGSCRVHRLTPSKPNAALVGSCSGSPDTQRWDIKHLDAKQLERKMSST